MASVNMVSSNSLETIGLIERIPDTAKYNILNVWIKDFNSYKVGFFEEYYLV